MSRTSHYSHYGGATPLSMSRDPYQHQTYRQPSPLQVLNFIRYKIYHVTLIQNSMTSSMPKASEWRRSQHFSPQRAVFDGI